MYKCIPNLCSRNLHIVNQLYLKKKNTDKKKTKQTLANYNRHSTEKHQVPSSQNMDQSVRRGADRRQGPSMAHRLAGSPGHHKPHVSLEEMRTLPT